MIKYKLDSGRRAVDRLCWRRSDNGSKTTGCSGCAHLCVDRDRCVPLCHAGVQRHGTRSAYSSLPRTFQQNVPPLQVFIHSCAWSCTPHRTATPPLSCNNARRSGMRFSPPHPYPTPPLPHSTPRHHDLGLDGLAIDTPDSVCRIL